MKSLLTFLTYCLLSAGLVHADNSKQQIENLISNYETALNGSDIKASTRSSASWKRRR